MTSWSPEISLIPARYPHQIFDKLAGQEQIDRINEALANLEVQTGVGMVAKLDPLLSHEYQWSYSVEIVPKTWFYSEWLEDDKEWAALRKALEALFLHLRKKEDLVPSVRKRRGANEIHAAGGGCHQHCSAVRFTPGVDWYDKMQLLHQNMLVDFANRPFFRWLFAQWFADEGGAMPFASNPELTANFTSMSPRGVYNHLLQMGNCSYIEPHFMATTKNSYLTYELRMFSMVDMPDELRLIGRVANRWMDQIEEVTDKGLTLPPTLTPSKLADMKGLKKSWSICAKWLDGLGVNPLLYRPFYDRHYANRIRFGKMV